MRIITIEPSSDASIVLECLVEGLDETEEHGLTAVIIEFWEEGVAEDGEEVVDEYDEEEGEEECDFGFPEGANDVA